jgi:hypothetical protein
LRARASDNGAHRSAADGHALAFAIFTDAIPTETAHTVQDNMAITIADY